MSDWPAFRPMGTAALLVEFAPSASPATITAVRALDAALQANPPRGLQEVVPTAASLMAVFDPLVTDHAVLTEALRGALMAPPPPARTPALHEVPICTDPDLAPDLAEVAERLGLTPEAVSDLHQGAEFTVSFYGFAPGYAYLDGLPPALRLDRKPVPKRGVPAGSVIIAGGQCLITTQTMPTGWWIIGRTPFAVLTGDPEHPFRLQTGDRLRFVPAPRSVLEADA